MLCKTTGSIAEKTRETAADSNPVDYQNVITNVNATIDGSQAATYMELRSSTRASPSVYASINIPGKMETTPRALEPVYENIADF